MVTLRQGQLVHMNGEIGVCVSRDEGHYGLLFPDETYDEFTPAQLAAFNVRGVNFVDEEAKGYKFVSVIRLIDDFRNGHFLMFRTVVFPNGVPYAGE